MANRENKIDCSWLHLSKYKFYRTCQTEESYSSYDCREDYVEKKIEKEVSCGLPHQAHNNPKSNRKICTNMTMFRGERVKHILQH